MINRPNVLVVYSTDTYDPTDFDLIVEYGLGEMMPWCRIQSRDVLVINQLKHLLPWKNIGSTNRGFFTRSIEIDPEQLWKILDELSLLINANVRNCTDYFP